MKTMLFALVFVLTLLGVQGALAAEPLKGGYCTAAYGSTIARPMFECDAFKDEKVSIQDIYRKGWRVINFVSISGNTISTYCLVIEEQPKTRK